MTDRHRGHAYLFLHLLPLGRSCRLKGVELDKCLHCPLPVDRRAWLLLLLLLATTIVLTFIVFVLILLALRHVNKQEKLGRGELVGEARGILEIWEREQAPAQTH